MHHEGKGFLEDRRPASNLDPYIVLRQIMKSVLDYEPPKEEEEKIQKN